MVGHRPRDGEGSGAVTPVERLKAAIEKLEAAKRGEKWGPSFGIAGTALQAQNADDQWRFITPEIHREDADLIVTLHRTIGAQLAILRLGLAFTAPDALRDTAPLAALALADAILGTTPAPDLSDRERAEVARFGIHPELTMAEDF